MRTVTRALVPACVALLLVWASPLHAEVKNLSGTWKLNLEKSEAEGLPAPKGAVIIKAVHKEPALNYSVTSTDAEGKPINSTFDGAIDGKPYKDTDGGSITYKRINDNTIAGTSIYGDAKTTDTFTTTVSADGKSFTRKGTFKDPNGEHKYSEVWEKQ